MPKNQSISSVTAKEVEKIVFDRVSTRSMKVFVDLRTGSWTGFDKISLQPVHFRIIQDMVENYTDYMVLRLEVTPYQYEQIIENYQDLYADVVLKHKDEYSDETDEDAVLRIKRKALVKNYKKLTQSYTTAQLEAVYENGEDLIPIELELIEEEMYAIRKREIQFLATSVTMRDAILLVCKMLGFKKVHLIPPDNQTVYTNFIIPPMKDLSTIFSFLQNTEGMGVYQRGCNWYYSQGILYIYPEHNPHLDKGFATHIYNIGSNEFQGMGNYHRWDEKGNLHILTADETDIENIVQTGIENRRTGSVLYRTENVVDHWHHTPGLMAAVQRYATKAAKKAAIEYIKAQFPVADIALKAYKKLEDIQAVGSVGDWAQAQAGLSSSGPGPVVDNDNFDSVQCDEDIGMANIEEAKSGGVKPNYNNPYVEASEIASSYKNRMSVIWQHAVPLAIKPSYPIKFHYEESNSGNDEKPDWSNGTEKDKSVKVLNGICEKTVYTIHRLERQDELIFGCHGELQLTIDPKQS